MSARRRGFTLIELLAVLSIVSLLLALALPAVQYAREAARRARCQSQLRQMGIAFHHYQSSHRVFSPGTVLGGWSWQTMLLPNLEQPAVYGLIDFANNVAHPDRRYSCIPESQRLSATASGWDAVKSIWQCPSNPQLTPIYSGYRGVAGKEGLTGIRDVFVGDPVNLRLSGMLFLCSSVRPGDVTDGASQTLFVGETGSPASVFCGSETGERESWLSTIGGLRPGHFDDSVTSHFWSYHPGGANFLFVDGHVQFLSYSLDATTFLHLGSRNGGEVVDW